MKRAAGIEKASDSESGGGSFLTPQVASNDARIIPPPFQFSDALFSHSFADNY